MGLSTISSAVNASSQAKAQNRQMEYNAKVSANNAQISQNEADYARGQSIKNANEKRRETALLIGKQRAKMGASGAVVDSGSFLDITMSTAEQGEMDAMALIHEGDKQAWQYEFQAAKYKDEANMYRSSKQSSGAAVFGSLLSSAEDFTKSKMFASLGT